MPYKKLSAVVFFFLLGSAYAHDGMDHSAMHGHTERPEKLAPQKFVATTEESFAQLMDEAMAIMSRDMEQAPMNGQPDHDFVSMMIPHHQGAVDMAKALLLYSKDPELRNLSQGIIAEQQIEIQLMQQWLKQHGRSASVPAN